MARQVLVLGGGTGGTLVANRLRRRFPADDLTITVVDADDRHLYQPGLLFVPFGLSRPSRLVRPRHARLLADVHFRQATVSHVDVDARRVAFEDGDSLRYDALVVATGARLVPEQTEGMTGAGWREKVFTFYDMPGSAALAGALAGFDRGRLVVGFVDLPIKCPVAPLEFAFLADWYFRRRGIRHRVDISFVTPLDGAFTKPVCSAALGGLLEEKGIELVSEFNTGEIDGAGGRLLSYDDRQVPFDLAVMTPLHEGPAYLARSPGLADELGFVPCDMHSLQSKASADVFVVGDGADVPTSKAGSVAHFEGEVLVDNIAAHLRGEPPLSQFDGHTNCFVETGFGRALLVDFNYDTQPLPGHYPGRVGLPLMRESRLCHLGKRLFEPFYWHVLLSGRDVPGISSSMPRAGKDFDVEEA